MRITQSLNIRMESIRPDQAFGGKRGKKHLVHRELAYLAMRVAMDTRMRPGSLRKLKWRDIGENTAIPKEERKIWVNIKELPSK